MEKIMCVEPGIIVLARVNKDGSLSKRNREDVTSACIIATMQHLMCTRDFLDCGMSGYKWAKKDAGSNVSLALFDSEKYELAPNGRKVEKDQ